MDIRRTLGGSVALVAAALMGLTTATGAPPAPPAPQAGQSITLRQIATGFERPVYATNAGDGSGRLFVVEKEGRVRVIKNGQLLATPFIDISDRVEDSGNEQGLLSVAFHPNFAANRRFFVYYTGPDQGDTYPLTISEFKASAGNPDIADRGETIVIRVPHPANADNHNGGQLQFGPDGFLYAGTGDGGGSNDTFGNGQNIDSLLAKILRLDVDSASPYAIPPDNPFAGAAAGRDEIYAWGFRNPWRFSFDRATGQLWVGDVGQNVTEEIDIVKRGANYGWSIMEGSHCRPPILTCNMAGLELPVFEYDHSGSNGVPGGACSITGGFVYRGARSPSLVGTYIFADYCSGSGSLFGIRAGDRTATVFSTGVDAGPITSFGQGENGELYAITDSQFGGNGALFELMGPAGGCALTCAPDVTVEDADGSGAEAVNFAAPTPSGDCGTVTCSPASGASFQVGTTTVTCTAGAATCSFSVRVTARGGLSVTSCDPSSAPRKTTVNDLRITGTGFANGATVSFGKKIAVLSTTVVSSTEIRVSVKVKKAKRGPRGVTVRNPDGTTFTASSCFTVS